MKVLHVRIALDMTGGDAETAPLRLSEMFGYSLVTSWGASAGRAGTLKLQASNNAYFKLYKNKQNSSDFEDMQEEIYNASYDPNATWVDITGSEKTVDGTADSHAYSVGDAYYTAVRWVWVETTAGAASPDKAVGYFHAQGNLT